MQHAPTPKRFTTWAAIHAVGAAAERRIWTSLGNFRIHPNVFVFLVGPPGTGKCLGPDEYVLLFDGGFKKAKDVVVGDQLMGPDSTPRNVLSTSPGFGHMFRVTPNKGTPWECNGQHILSLRKSRNPGAGQIKFVSVAEWLGWTAWQRSEWKQWSTGVEFPVQSIPLPVSPYLLGVLLGDGSTAWGGVAVTTNDFEVVDFLKEEMKVWDLEVTTRRSMSDHGLGMYGLVSRKWHDNSLLNKLREMGMDNACGNKNIPFEYQTASREDRLRLLAGLMDTDGSLGRSGNYDFISKSRSLSHGTAFVARSLGFYVSMSECQKTCTNNGVVGTYWRVSISGNIDEIPCLIERKKANPRNINKAVGSTGFEIEPIGEGPWAGFEVDGDHQFLLHDFTVTHNSISINPMSSLLHKSQAVFVAPTDMTKQGLLDALMGAKSGSIVDGVPFDYHFMCICISELSNFMSQYDGALAGLLTDLFDCPPIIEEQKRGRGDESSVINFPGISFIMGTATKNLGNTIGDELWGSGFMARVIMVYSAEEVVPENMFAKVEDNKLLYEQLATKLRRIGDLKGEMQWDLHAQVELIHFRNNNKVGAPIHNRLETYVVRRWMHLAKLCMIAALSDERMTVEMADVAQAKQWLFDAEHEMPEIFKDMVSHSDGQMFEELRSQMFSAYLQSGKKPVEAATVYAWLSKRVSSYAIERMIEVALASDYLRRVAGTSGLDALYIPTMPNGVKNVGVI